MLLNPDVISRFEIEYSLNPRCLKVNHILNYTLLKYYFKKSYVTAFSAAFTHLFFDPYD